MTTSLNIIERALLDIGVLEGGGSATAQEASDGLVYLNDLIQSLSNEGLMIYQSVTEGFSVTGATSYTMGSGATFSTTRPLSINSAYFRLNGSDYPVSVVNVDQYNAIVDKSATSDIPDVIYVDYGNPNVTVYFYPVPSSGTIYFTSNKPLTEQATIATVLAMPPGYERMLRLNLAVEMMPMYGVLKQDVMALAAKAKMDIKRLNAVNRRLVVGLGLPIGRNYGNILQGP